MEQRRLDTNCRLGGELSMESQIFRRVITDREMYALGPDTVSGVVNEAVRRLNEDCARYIADNMPHDAYQLLRIHREVTRDEPMARTVVMVRLDVGEVTAHPRISIQVDEASDSRPVRDRSPLAPVVEEVQRERPSAMRQTSDDIRQRAADWFAEAMRAQRHLERTAERQDSRPDWMDALAYAQRVVPQMERAELERQAEEERAEDERQAAGWPVDPRPPLAASPSPEQLRQWHQEYREEISRRHEAINQDYINRGIVDAWRRLQERVQQAPDGPAVPIYGQFPTGYHHGVDPAQTKPPQPKEPEHTPIRRHICVAKQTADA